MNKLKVIIALVILSSPVSAQILHKNDWQKERLLDRPSKVEVAIFKNVEKFGDLVEELVTKEESTFDNRGNYLTYKIEDLTRKKNDKSTVFNYESTSGNLIKIKYKNIDWSYSGVATGYSYNLEWVNGLLMKKFVSDVYSLSIKYCSFEYEYDGQRRNTTIKTYDCNNNLIEMTKFIYKDSLLVQTSNYNNSGILTSKTEQEYDPHKNLDIIKKYNKEGNILKLDECVFYNYNSNDQIVNESTGMKSTHSKEKLYEYYPNGLLKKISTNDVDLRNNEKRTIVEICEYTSYDKFGNWVEQVKWEFNVDLLKFMLLYKYKRKISYY